MFRTQSKDSSTYKKKIVNSCKGIKIEIALVHNYFKRKKISKQKI